MAAGWHFEARFKLAPGQRIHHDDLQLVLAIDAARATITLLADGASKLRDASRVTLNGSPYGSEESARAAGEQAVRRLLLSCLARNVGLHTDSEGPALVDGVDVWTGFRLKSIIRGSAGAGAITGVGGDALARQFEADSAFWKVASPDDVGLINLLAELHFDLSDRSRLLLAMALIELACTPAHDRDRHTVKRGECKRKIEAFLGKSIAKEYEELYVTRNKVAHRPHVAGKISSAASSAQSLACHLVRALFVEPTGGEPDAS